MYSCGLFVILLPYPLHITHIHKVLAIMSSVLHKKAAEDNWVKYTRAAAAAASDDSEWAKSVPHKRFWQPAIISRA